MTDLSMHIPLEGDVNNIEQNTEDTAMVDRHGDRQQKLPQENGDGHINEEHHVQLEGGDMHHLQGLINASLAEDTDNANDNDVVHQGHQDINIDDIHQQSIQMESSFINDKDTFQLNDQSNIAEDEESMMEAVAAAAAVAALNKRSFYDTTEEDTSNKKLHVQSSSNTTTEEQDDNSNGNGLLQENSDLLGEETSMLRNTIHSGMLAGESQNNIDDAEHSDIRASSPFKQSDPRSKFIRFALNKTTDHIKKPAVYNNSMNSTPLPTPPPIAAPKKAKKDALKNNVPKNSRFFKVYNLEGQKSTLKASSIHHYNPYRYPQNRSKLNPHPDFIKSARKEAMSASEVASIAGISSIESKFDRGILMGKELSGMKAQKQEIPVFHPTMEEFQDIYAYIESLTDVGKKYGAVKIIPPKEYEPKFAINLESFWIKSTRQSWRPPVDEFNSRCEFYRQLKDCLQGSMNKLPCIDKRSIDLYRLYRVVKLRGGFQACCNDKLWAQIGREMGFYGKISSSLSSSIKSVYQKYIIPWEKQYENVNQDFLNIARNDKSRELFPENVRTINSNIALDKRSSDATDVKMEFETQPAVAENQTTETLNSQTVINPEAITSASPSIEVATVTEGTEVDAEEEKEKKEKLPIILGSSNVYTRSRQMLANVGFATHYDQSTTQKRGITLGDLHTLKGYDFYNWMHTDRIDDTIPTEMKISSLYTLKQFYDKSRILKSQMLSRFFPSDHQNFDDSNFLEETFWRFLENKEAMFETEVSTHQTTNIHDSSCEYKFLSDKSGSISDSVLGSLNFNNTSVADGSLLQYIDADTDSFFHSYLNFSMFYGSQSWSVEDNWFYKVDYHYLGDAKSVYVIPPEFQEKYEQLLKSKLGERQNEIQNITDAVKLFEKVICNYDIFNASLENQTCYDMNLPRAQSTDPHFRKLANISTNPMRYNSDLMLSPAYLKENGIPVYQTFQHVGEMLIKFPKAYTSYFSLGTCVTESVNIANLDWLNESTGLTKWFQNQQLLPKFSISAMLLTAAYESTDRKILAGMKPVLEKFIGEEICKRNELRALIPKELNFNKTYEAVSSLDAIQKEYQEMNQNTSDFIDEVETVGSRLVSKLAKWNRFADADLGDIFPTFILAKCKSTDGSNNVDNLSSFTISSDYFKENYDKLGLSTSEFEFHLISLVSDDYLRKSLDAVNSKLETMEQWYARYFGVLNEGAKPSFERLNELCEAGKCIFKNQNISHLLLSDEQKHILDVFRNLKALMVDNEEWIKTARSLLSIREANVEPLVSFEELRELVSGIPKLLVSSPEEKAILNLIDEVYRFDESAKDALSKSVPELDMDLLSRLQATGNELKIKLKAFKLIDTIVRRNKWMVNMRNDMMPLEELESAYEQGKSIPNLNEQDEKRLEELKAKIEKTSIVQREYERIKSGSELIKYKEIEILSHKCDGLPLPDAKKYFDGLIAEYKEVQEKIIPLLDSVEEKCDIFEALSPFEFVKRFEAFKVYNERVAKLINDEKIHRKHALKSLKKFDDLSDRSKLFNAQLIEGPNINESELNANYESILRFGKDDYRYLQPMSEVDCIKYYRNYNLSVLRCRDDAYCVCKQTHEGNMVECEMCQQWFHFNCIGYQSKGSPGESDNKYLCALCDYENKLPTTRKFHVEIGHKITFEEMFAIAQKMMNRSCLLTAKGLAFLEMVNTFHQAYEEILALGIVEEVAVDGVGQEGEESAIEKPLVCRSADLGKIRKLLEKVDGCLFNYNILQTALRVRYVELCRLRDGKL